MASRKPKAGHTYYNGRYRTPEEIEREKERVRLKNKRYYQDNKEKESERKKQYYYENKAHLNKKRNEYKRNPVSREKQKEYSRRHYLKHQQEIIDRSKRYRENNREKVNEQAKEYRRRVDPTIRISDIIHDLNRGDCTLDEFSRRVQRVIDDIDEKGS